MVITKKAIDNGAKVVAQKLKEHKLKITDVKQHFDWCNKFCSEQLMRGYKGISWQDFLTLVKEHLEGKTADKSKPTKPTTNNKDQFLIRVKVNGLHTYTKADWDAKKGAPMVNKGEIFTVVETLTVNGSKVYKLKSGWYITGATKYVEIYKKIAPKPKPKSFKVGQKVKIKSSAGKYSRANVMIPAKYKNKTLTVQQVGKSDVLIKELVSWVKKTDVQ